MSFPDTSSEYYTPEQELQALQVLVPGAFVAMSLNLIGVVAFYSFRKQRAFPSSLLAWIGIANIAYMWYLIAKWAKWSKGFAFIVENGIPGSPGCSLSVFADAFDTYMIVALNTLVSIMLFMSISLKIDLSPKNNPKYQYWFIGAFWVWALTIPLIVMIYNTTSTSNGRIGFCFAGDLSYLVVIPQLVVVAVQIGLTSHAVIKARAIIAAASSSATRSKKDVRMLYLLVRCIGTIIAEFLVISSVFPATIDSYLGKSLNVSEIKWAVVSAFLGPCIDGAILIFGNRELARFLLSKVFTGYSSSSSGSDVTLKTYPDSKSTKSVSASIVDV